MCPYPECNGRTFSASKNLKAHLKVHENKEAEALLQQQDADAGRPTKRRRGGEVGRDWECTEKGCDKTFKSVRTPLLYDLARLTSPRKRLSKHTTT
jgi:general transcription factor IIIA